MATITSDAYGVSANVKLTLLSLVAVNAAVGPLNQVAGTAGPSYSLAGTPVATVNANLDLGVDLPLGFLGVRQNLGTGLLTSSAQSPYPTTEFGSARSQVDNLDFSLGVDSSALGTNILSLLGIRADTIISRSEVSGGAPYDTLGFSSIEGLTLSGSLFSRAVINRAAAGAFINPDKNTLLLGVGLLGQETLKIVLNEQVETTGPTSAGITTNAIHIIFSDYLLAGVGKLRGDVVIGHTHAFIESVSSATPEPAVWAQMIAGFGLIGLVTRRRRQAVA